MSDAYVRLFGFFFPLFASRSWTVLSGVKVGRFLFPCNFVVLFTSFLQTWGPLREFRLAPVAILTVLFFPPPSMQEFIPFEIPPSPKPLPHFGHAQHPSPSSAPLFFSASSWKLFYFSRGPVKSLFCRWRFTRPPPHPVPFTSD